MWRSHSALWKRHSATAAYVQNNALPTLWALAQVGSAPCGGFRSKHPVETPFNDFFSLNQGMKRVCTAFLERKPPQGADSTWASAHKVRKYPQQPN
jgi:hypothetical protein